MFVSKTFSGLAAVACLFAGCGSNHEGDSAKAHIVSHSETQVLSHPDWSRNATIYEVNVRQHTPEGTFAAFEKDIPRLRDMGVRILWLMPIHPIGKVNRKGSLGSYYSVRDYMAINPEYGTEDDFRGLVQTAHAAGMKVILDWVANHSAFDNGWTITHPEYYLPDSAGKIQPPLNTDWWDVAQLDWTRRDNGLRAAMTDALKYWVKEFDVDGYRCDVAEKVPQDYWEEARAALDSIKPVFMLAEAELPAHHLKAFDMSYTWHYMGLCNDIGAGKKHFSEIDAYMAAQDTLFPVSAYRMYFTTNHDENSWKGTCAERFGPLAPLMDVMTFTIAGMPLAYTGQEGGEAYPDGTPHRLRFFDKDTAHWNGYKRQDVIAKLFNAHLANPALWNGEYGGDYSRVKTSNDDEIYCYTRTRGDNVVLVMLNFSNKSQRIDLIGELEGEFSSIFNNQTLKVFTRGDAKLASYGYQVFVKK